MITTIQIIIIVLALFALSRVILRLRDNEITILEFIFWSIVWLSVIIIAFNPNIISNISSLFGIGRGVDLLVYFGLLILFYLMFKILVKMERIEQQITKITTNIALQNVKGKKSKK